MARFCGRSAHTGDEMADMAVDFVAQYGISRGWTLLPRSTLVEGTSDVALFELANALFLRATGKSLLSDLAIVAAGEADRGGTKGVVRELIVLRGLAAAFLSPAGLPVYRFIGLFDNDTAGQKSVHGAHGIDSSIIEYRDVFRLQPVMPRPGNIDPAALKRSFEKENAVYKGLHWELEDLLAEPLLELFVEEHPTALLREMHVGDAAHREFTRDGKHQLIRFCQKHAALDDLADVVGVLHALRHYLNLPELS
jgi:hypothetical protein